jgi:hypothetical protein
MSKILSLSIILFFPIICFSQDKIVGQFTTQQVTHSIGQQQVGQQGNWGYSINVGRSYLTVSGKKYDLYRYSKEEIQNLYMPNNGQQQQVQQPVSVMVKDFYLLGHQNENLKYCLFNGTIDEEKGIIYSSSLIKTYDNNELVEALNKCGIK